MLVFDFSICEETDKTKSVNGVFMYTRSNKTNITAKEGRIIFGWQRGCRT